MTEGAGPPVGEDKQYDYDSWVLTEQSFPWLIETNGRYTQAMSWLPFISDINSVAVSKISSFRGMDVESWITSDGRAYLVQLVECDDPDTVTPQWEGVQADDSVRSLRGYKFRCEVNAQPFLSDTGF
jgi:hypothetical protein